MFFLYSKSSSDYKYNDYYYKYPLKNDQIKMAYNNCADELFEKKELKENPNLKNIIQQTKDNYPEIADELDEIDFNIDYEKISENLFERPIPWPCILCRGCYSWWSSSEVRRDVCGLPEPAWCRFSSIPSENGSLSSFRSVWEAVP